MTEVNTCKMTAPATPSTDADTASARTPPTADELTQALKVDVYDREGKTRPLGELVQGKRTVLVFTRHFFLIIGNGSYQPIDAYATNSSSAYPIYTDPTLRLHSLFKFKSALTEGKGDEKRDYMRNEGSAMSRVWGGIKGALGSLQHVTYVGPKALNGGEVIISADCECEYMYRMQNTVDHTNVSELARLIGVECTTEGGEDKAGQACGDSCAVEAK
ncbi:Thioredoxin AAED1 [Pyrenophora seminiperda CCB06]|uniref:Thioredoxin AAED1 n=1 Tax=Pyrenophora seminiperda CCB06 TaxID=1302712 RepID=A0A3M7M562_9PLEO|nr:Thioredoxin AAED1 [Pyrenophora seminiperda CCB06]